MAEQKDKGENPLKPITERELFEGYAKFATLRDEQVDKFPFSSLRTTAEVEEQYSNAVKMVEEYVVQNPGVTKNDVMEFMRFAGALADKELIERRLCEFIEFKGCTYKKTGKFAIVDNEGVYDGPWRLDPTDSKAIETFLCEFFREIVLKANENTKQPAQEL